MKLIRPTLIPLLLLALTLTAFSLVSCGGDTREYSYAVGDTVLTPGAYFTASPDSLGTYEYAESSSCGGIPGMDKVYRYAGFTLYTTPGADGDIIAGIELTDDSTATPEGLRVGCTRDEVTNALGIGESVGDNLVYTGTSSKLTVALRDGRVVGLVYGEN